MIKRLAGSFFLLCLSVCAQAQAYGNEWINYTQQYYRIPLPKTGLYRIDSATLVNAGIPLNTINPKNLQLFIKGQEQYVYLKGEGDNVFNSSDYLEFYAEKNDGRFDSLAYMNIAFLPSPYLAMWNDTNCAFVTWNSSLNNHRVTEETDVNFGGYTPETYYYAEAVQALAYGYTIGETYIEGISDPRYQKAEGYGYPLPKGQTLAMSANGLYQSGSLPVYVSASFSGSSRDYGWQYDHEVALQYRDFSGATVNIVDTFFFGYFPVQVNRQMPSSLWNTTSYLTTNNINSSLFSGANSALTVHYMSVKYPHISDFQSTNEQALFVGDNAAGSKAYLSINNVLTAGGPPIFYDLSNHRLIPVVQNAGNIQALVPNSGGEKKCFYTTQGNVNQVTSIRPVNQSGYFVNYINGNQDSAFIVISHASLASSAQAYKSYRQSAAGGSRHVILAFMNDLYDQFAYGNRGNPLAIRQFCRYLVNTLPNAPAHLLLWGKGIKHADVRTTPANWNFSLVPSIGYPASDNLFTSGFPGQTQLAPFIATGRVAAKNNIEGMAYLNKVMQHESLAPAEWRKHVIHFAGGTDANQQQQFQSYLSSYEQIITDTMFGGRVFNFRKTTTAPVQITISDSVKRLINEGASIITFFGHGSISGFDQAIDDPSQYNNTGKYPLLIANSCYSGDIHTQASNSTSENFTLIDQKGTIGFLASSSVGVVYPLNIYSHDVYRSLAYQTYGRGIGDCIRNACYISAATPGDPYLEITLLEMTLHGDPAVVIQNFRYPDYAISNNDVYFDTKTYVDSIGVNVNITNLGRAVSDTFVVRVERYYPLGDSVTFFKKIKAPLFKDTLSFFISKNYDKGVGLNKFKVFVDTYNQVVELQENNNSTIGTVDLFIEGGDIVPVYPYKYAVIPTAPSVTLKASTADPFSVPKNYRIQLDTSDAFVAPFNTTLLQSSGGVVEWTVSLPYGDSTVYFWRISRDSISPTDRYNWRESSFQTIINRNGWGQAHFHQFKNDGYQFVKYKKPQRRFDFENNVTSVQCRTGFLPYIAWDQISYSLNNSVRAISSCASDGWSLVVFDSTSAEPWVTISNNPPNASPGPLGNCHCDGTRPLYAFDFGTNNYCGFPNTWQGTLETALQSIPVNNMVLLYSEQNHQAQSYSNGLYTEFEKIGSAQIRNLKDTVPFIIFGRKKSTPSPGTANQELMGLNKQSILQLDDSIKTNWSNGYIASEIIGPSARWNSFHWRQRPVELPNRDSVVVKIVGIRTNGQRDTLATFPVDSMDVLDLVNYANANTYPYMQLVARMRDPVYKTPPQLKRWQVLYDLPPECAINPTKGFAIAKDTLQEGDEVVVRLPIENIGTLPFNDSLLVTYWIEDKDRINHALPARKKARPFNPGQVIMDTIRTATFGYPGLNYLWVDVNPPASTDYQIEQYHFNNIARIPFMVSTDKVNPLLDVTFDGTHILNGDLISAKPHVLVGLKDENQFLVLNDTADFVLYLKKPSDPQEKRIFFSQGLQFTPAQLPANSCKIEWWPNLPEDGKYLFIVQAKDRSNNNSGAIDYRIQFEILTKQTITEVLNYPNPFSTSTRFVFTLTGSEIPDIFTIQIMTISGKIVKEITKDELGALHVGRNITTYAWDGKDAFGDKLGNGVYLYRVITRQNGEKIEKRETEADQFFKKGWGKMVIIR